MAEKILIAGASGLLGTALVAALAREGTPVVALVRDPARAAAQLPGATVLAWEPSQGPAPAAAFEGVSAVVNFMGASIGDKRWSEARRRVLRESRIAATRALVDGLRACSAGPDGPRAVAVRPRVLVQISGIAYYGDRGDEVLTESSSVGSGFLAELARDWEAEAGKATEFGMRVVVLRLGVVLTSAGGFLGKIMPPFRLGLGGRVGGGQQWLPWLHVSDALGLIRHAIANESISGALNAVAPEPVTNAEFSATLGRTLGRPTVMAAPAFALRLALGADMANELLLASQRAMPVRTLETGYKFAQPMLAAALKDVVEAV